ncbi:MAG TPA: hypothetical protein PKM80_03275, partial [Candidatus Cloacimonas sp.]|nr:hypothetical protein [Candidatus Cloacimonas sp.]
KILKSLFRKSILRKLFSVASVAKYSSKILVSKTQSSKSLKSCSSHTYSICEICVICVRHSIISHPIIKQFVWNKFCINL